LLATGIAGIGALALRKRALRALDHRFFRREYEAEAVLTNFLPMLTATFSPQEVSRLLQAEIERTVQPASAVILLRSRRHNEFEPLVDGFRALPADSRIVSHLTSQQAPLTVDLTNPRSLSQGLP
jgi:hypothetical protein